MKKINKIFPPHYDPPQPLVTIWQGLIVGDGDWVSKQGVRNLLKKCLSQCIYACWLAALLISCSRKTHDQLSRFSLSKTLRKEWLPQK